MLILEKQIWYQIRYCNLCDGDDILLAVYEDNYDYFNACIIHEIINDVELKHVLKCLNKNRQKYSSRQKRKFIYEYINMQADAILNHIEKMEHIKKELTEFIYNPSRLFF